MAEGNESMFMKFLCGGLTGMTASTLTYPLDLIRTHLSLDVKVDGPKPSIIGTGSHLFKTRGFVGMYAGLGSSLLGIFPYVGIKMATFDILKTAIVLERSDPYFTLKNMTMGAIAGGTSIFATYPTDLIRRRMQMRGQDGIPNYSNFFDCGYKIA